MEKENVIRRHAEDLFREELEILQKHDRENKFGKPEQWSLSPVSVVTFLLGGKVGNAAISQKYFGNRRLIETAVASLVTDRALLLYGVPGTAKSWVSENLAAAISGDSTMLIQGTAGTDENSIRYGWNYAKLLTEGPSETALVKSPMARAMESGKLARIEELTRVPSEVQDTLITILSEKTLPVPELNSEIQAIQGFNVIATANNKDRGVNELSSALKRRFNTVILPLPSTLEEEVKIVESRVNSLSKNWGLPSAPPALEEIRKVVTIFRELRNGQTVDNKTKLKTPSGTLSTAEAIDVIGGGLSLAAYFGNQELQAEDWSSNIIGALIKDPSHDLIVVKEYLETVVKERDGWKPVYKAMKEII